MKAINISEQHVLLQLELTLLHLGMTLLSICTTYSTSILSKQRRKSSSEKEYVKQFRKNRVKDRKGIYYLQERRNKITVKKTYSSSRQRAKQQIQRLKNIKERLGKSRIGIYSGKRPAYDPVKNHHYPGEGIQNKTNLRIKKARQVMKEDDKFHYNSPSNLKIYSRKYLIDFTASPSNIYKTDCVD